MGITGLLPFLEKASKKTHVRELKGCTAAVDAYCWLHKGAFGCAEKLARGEDTDGYVLYCMKYIKMLKLHGIRPIMVFDGQHLPAKKLTEEKRRKQRKLAKQKAAEMLRLGNVAEARKFASQSIDITHKMALAVIKECRRNGVDCIVAPYEADAQMAYLNRMKLADFVITEDSDLLLFGCKKIFFKMDISGHGTLVDADKINDCMKLRQDRYTFDKFRYMCIMSGCDYLESLPGVGLKKALKFISVTENPSIYNALPKMPKYLNLSNVVVTDEYRDNFMLADATFQYQLVFDPTKRCLVPLNTITSNTNVEYHKNAGNMTDNELAFQLAVGNIDPFTHKQVDDWNPDTCILPVNSIWLKNVHKSINLTEQLSTHPAHHLKKKATIHKVLETDTFGEATEEILSMYSKMEVPKKSEVKEVKDLSEFIHGDLDVSTKHHSNHFHKFGPTIVDYENGTHSRFFKPKGEPKIKTDEPVDSLLGAIDNLMKKRKTMECCAGDNNTSPENKKSPKIVAKRRKSDIENRIDISMNLTEIFQFKKEKVQSSKINLDSRLNKDESESKQMTSLENVAVMEIRVPDRNESVCQEILNGTEILKSTQISTSLTLAKTVCYQDAKPRVIKKQQSSILNFFSKQ